MNPLSRAALEYRLGILQEQTDNDERFVTIEREEAIAAFQMALESLGEEGK